MILPVNLARIPELFLCSKKFYVHMFAAVLCYSLACLLLFVSFRSGRYAYHGRLPHKKIYKATSRE